MTFAQIFLGLNAAGIGLIGLAYLYDPNLLLARYKLEATNAGMDNMLRSAYGGLFVGMAAIFACGAFLPAHTSDVLLFTVLFMGGLALGRVVSVLRAGTPGWAVNSLLGYELTAAIVAAALRYREASDALALMG